MIKKLLSFSEATVLDVFLANLKIVEVCVLFCFVFKIYFFLIIEGILF